MVRVDGMKCVTDLGDDQLLELKRSYLDEHILEVEGRSASYGELMDADEIVSDSVIFEAYDSYLFSDDDFVISAAKKIEMEINCGYLIRAKMMYGGVGIVLGHREEDDNWVTWSTDGCGDYYWGHYFPDGCRQQAVDDFLKRCAGELQWEVATYIGEN